MTKRNRRYWQERFEALEDTLHRDAMRIMPDIDRTYKRAQADIEKEIRVWYQRLADNNGVSMTEARKLLASGELQEFRWTVEEYIKRGKENAIDQRWMGQLENASARVHITRLEALKLQVQQSIEPVYGNQLDMLDGSMRKLYQEGYYRTAFELQKGLEIGWPVAEIDQKKLDRIISKPWALDGRNFSSRIWGNRTKLVNELHTELSRMCLTGATPDKAIRNIAKKMQTSRYNAGTLVMTESAAFGSAAQADCFHDLGVKQYEICATLDSHTSEICRGLDGKVYDMSVYEVGVTAPPFHVKCRTCTCPYFNDEFTVGEMRAARGENGKTYHVPADMKYSQWEKSFVGSGDKTDLRFVTVNDTMKPKKETIKSLEKLKQSGMDGTDYDEYLRIINNHKNPNIVQLYKTFADEITKVEKTTRAEYTPSSKLLAFNYPKYEDMPKYGTLAHEYGHFFDAEVKFEGLHFHEIQTVQNATGLNTVFKAVASSSDEFLTAIRKDKEHIRNIFTPDVKADLVAHNASHGVQDAIDGLFPKSRIRWGHGERYYNRKYASVESVDRVSNASIKKKLQQVYNDLGLDASNLTKVKITCRQYEAASEAWANIMSAEVCGGDALEYVKKYLPNSYKAMLKILKGVK